jgi:hypothetical protein
MKTKLVYSILWLTVFSLAMGYLEAVVVVFLRELYYPSGFRFPLVPMDATLAKVEFCREAATLVMLAGIGYLAGRTPNQRLAAFLYAFAIWDLGYYLFLKGVLNWPESLLTWDILFPIPVPWIGPVLAPCLLSLTMVVLAYVLVRKPAHQLSLRRPDWLLLTAGSAVILASFVWDYLSFVLRQQGQVWEVSSQRSLFVESAAYVPVDFNWWIFGAGGLLLLWAIRQVAFRKPATSAHSPPPAVPVGAEPESFSDYLNAL